jgi:hypothetical protein
VLLLPLCRTASWVQARHLLLPLLLLLLVL